MKVKALKFGIKITTILLFAISYGCSNQSHKESVMTSPVDIVENFETIETEKGINNHEIDESNIPLDLKIIKSASARYKVKNIKEATLKIKAIAKKHGAYISDLRFENDLYRKENRFTIKVPQKYFDVVIDSVNTVVDFVEYENITTKDVTEEYVDLETRLKTKIEVKGRYENILRKNAKTVQDILKTEDKIRVIQEEIEAAQGRLKYLTSKVAFSTIQIDLYEAVDYKEKPETYSKSFFNKATQGLSNGWSFVEGLLIVLINIWPLLIIGGIVSYIIIRKRIRK